jgi:hypothetical protein
MEEEAEKGTDGAKKAWRLIMSWVGGITALIGLFGSLAGGVTWFVNHQKQKTELNAKLALAQGQTKQGKYKAAVETYGDILKADPLYRPALDQQLNTAMLWAENFSVVAREDQDAGDLAAPDLDEILGILDAGLTRSKGTQAADVQAHIGWTHWLNHHIAAREFGPAAEQNFNAALALDPSNVYANAMLGNWMLRNGKNLNEGVPHLNAAVSTGKARPLVRSMQLGGLIYLDQPGARGELVKIANDMRKSGEPLDEGHVDRILSFCFDPIVTDHKELVESLSAVPADDAWQTYLWLDNSVKNGADHSIVHEFISANLLEVSGKREEALEKYRALQQGLTKQPGTMKSSVDAAVARLSHN